MPGEREIRETANALRRHFGDSSQGRGDEVLPLYARLSVEEQRKAFRPHPGRRIVIATNVAETSITVPGIRYVIDPGTARLSRYSARTKVQGLDIEPISQASANQRQGRCGRVGPGVCYRLYSARTTSRAGTSSRPPRSCAPTSRASSCRCRRSSWAAPTDSPSSSRPILA
jgi:ATP-dependent helicase HrpA